MNYLQKKYIVNGGMLPQFANKPVSIIGRVRDIDANGMYFTIDSSDGIIVKVILKTRMYSPLKGWVEVSGYSTGKEIDAVEFVSFSNEEFDCQAYNDLCSFLYSIPNVLATC